MNVTQKTLREAREACGLSRKELARKLYISEKSIISWEQGVRKMPLAYEKLAAHRLFGVPLEDIE